MHLPHPFYKFPFRFDVDRLKAETEAFAEDVWCRHPKDYTGNTALPLISSGGEINDDFAPPMRPTEHLEKAPYIRQILGQFQTVIGRARLMRLEPECGVPSHIDLQYYWRSRTRVHIPVTTHPDIRFHCADAGVHMAAGEAWTFDNWLKHRVENPTSVRRVHLVFDTFGSSAFWAMARPPGQELPPREVAFDPAHKPRLFFESYKGDPILPPGDVTHEMLQLLTEVAAHKGNDAAAVARLQALFMDFCRDWRCIWASTGPTAEGKPMFAGLIEQFRQALKQVPDDVRIASNGYPVKRILAGTLKTLSRPLSAPTPTPTPAAAPAAIRFERPIFIVAAPRSGSTLLYEMLAENGTLWTVGGESHGLIEGIPELKPAARDYASNRLTDADATPAIADRLHGNFLAKLRDADGRPAAEAGPEGGGAVRFLEKTPKNALRIPFLKALYPDAGFIFLHRAPEANISSIMEAWRSGRFVTYRTLPGWTGLPWSLLLIPGWRDLIGAPLERIALDQWRTTNETVMGDLAALPDEDWCSVGYEELTGAPEQTCRRLCAFMGVPFDERMQRVTAGPLRPSRYTLTAPAPEKWRKNEAEILSVIAGAERTSSELQQFCGRGR